MSASSRRAFLLGPIQRLREVASERSALPEDPGVAPTPSAPLVALLDPRRCMNGLGMICTVCAERCPVEGAMRLVDGRPVVDPRACTGCGLCQDVCPAPEDAVRLVRAKMGVPA